MEIVIGVDLGGTHVSVACMDARSDLTQPEYRKVSRPLVDEDKTFERVLEIVAAAMKEVVSGLEPGTVVRGIGFALPGNADPTNGVCRYLPNFPAWGLNLPLVSALRQAIQVVGISTIDSVKVPVHIRNDGRCAAIAEARLGVGKGVTVMALLTLGTGIGGALITNGLLFNGASFDAGDFGHHSIYTMNPFICNCGKTACFEFQASALGLVRHYQSERARVGASACATANALQVVTEYRKGDNIAAKAFDNYLDDLSSGLANLVTFYNPNVIVLGGGLANIREFYEPSPTAPSRNLLEALVDGKTLVMTRGVVSIRQASLGDDAGVIGACLLAI